MTVGDLKQILADYKDMDDILVEIKDYENQNNLYEVKEIEHSLKGMALKIDFEQLISKEVNSVTIEYSDGTSEEFY